MTDGGFLVVKGGRAITLITLLSALTLVFALTYTGTHAHALGADATATSVVVAEAPSIIPADGTTASTITAVVTDVNGNNVPDGTTVGFTTTLGILSSSTATTVSGNASVTLVSDSMNTPGVAAVIAQAGSASGSAAVTIAAAGTPTKLRITVPSSCDVNAVCTLTVAATDAFGKPVPDGTSVYLAASDGSMAGNPELTNGGTATFVYTAPAMTETVTLTATSATGLAPAATANLQIGNAIANPVSLPGATQRTMPLTSTGEFCFLYDGQATAVAGFPSLFNPAVASVNIGATDGSYMSWMSAAPALATATSLSNGQFICVSAPVGSTVFAQ